MTFVSFVFSECLRYYILIFTEQGSNDFNMSQQEEQHYKISE